MSTDSSAIAAGPSPLSGLRWGFLGVLAFSFTVPLTRVAVGGDSGLDPVFVGSARAVVAALLAVIALGGVALHTGALRFPTPSQWLRLTPISLGVVLGFPLLTSIAMRDTSSGHAAVLIGLLPAATAVVAVILTRERPGRRFWVGAALGALATVVFAIAVHGSVSGGGRTDLLLGGAVALAAIGYAQGGQMARELGAWQTICWSLLLAAPVMTVLAARSIHLHPPHASAGQWAAFAYLAGVSMFLGFFAWYRGLGIGPMTTVSQIQLVQPVLTVGWSIAFFGEQPTLTLILGGLAVIACAAYTVRSRTSLGSRTSPTQAPVLPVRESLS